MPGFSALFSSDRINGIFWVAVNVWMVIASGRAQAGRVCPDRL